MGQIKPIKKARLSVQSVEERSVAYLKWISANLGNKYKMVPYFAAMMIEEIKDGPVLDAKAEAQLAVADALAALTDPSSS